MKPVYIGFTKQPYAIIVWQFEKSRSKTICYSEAELQSALARYYTQGDLYFMVPHRVYYFNKQAIPA